MQTHSRRTKIVLMDVFAGMTTMSTDASNIETCYTDLKKLMDKWTKRGITVLTSLTALSYYCESTLEPIREQCPDKANEFDTKITENVKRLLEEDQVRYDLFKAFEAKGIDPELTAVKARKRLSPAEMRRYQFRDLR
jgi:hypothetical protein